MWESTSSSVRIQKDAFRTAEWKLVDLWLAGPCLLQSAQVMHPEILSMLFPMACLGPSSNDDKVVLISGNCEFNEHCYALIRQDPLSPKTYLSQNADHRTVCKAAVWCHGKLLLLHTETGPAEG